MRYRTLDSLRGVAALIVVLHHCALLFPHGGESRASLAALGIAAPAAWLYLTPLRLLVAGPAAVLVFFVLSGFVLSFAFMAHDGEAYAPFLVKRVARIWLPFAAVILVAAILSHLILPGQEMGLSGWAALSTPPPASLADVAQHLAMTGTATRLDSPMWSLVQEMRVSAIFPLLVLATRRNWPMTLGLSIAACLVSVKILGLHLVDGFEASLVSTLIYVPLFVVGIVLAMRLHAIQARLASLPGLMVWAVGLAGVAYAPERTDIIMTLRDAALLLANGVAAALILVLCTMDGGASRWLLGALPRFLGRISYSLYLVHVVVIGTVLKLAYGEVPLPILATVAVVISIALADLSQRFLEAPAMRLGQRLARGAARPSRVPAEAVDIRVNRSALRRDPDITVRQN